MERHTSDPFLTTPNFRIQEVPELDQNQLQNLKQKIINILRTFNDKEILSQAINNLAIPKNLVDIEYVNTRPQHQMQKIHTIVCALKKQVYKMKRTPEIQQFPKVAQIQSPKTTQSNTPREKPKISIRKSQQYLKKQISPEIKMKQAILKQLEYRQKLQTRSNKISTAQKVKSQFLQKRRQNAKAMNKKVSEFYQKYKENQQNQFQKTFATTLLSYNNDLQSQQIRRNFILMSSSAKRDDNYLIVKQRLQRSNLKFEEYLERQNFMRLQREKSLEKFKDRRMNSLNERIMSHKAKSQEVLKRKMISSSEEENRKLNDFILKQIKYQQKKKMNALKDNNRNSESTQSQTRNHLRMHETKSVDLQKQTQKQNLILQKIMKKNELKEGLINERVERIKWKHRVNEEKRELFKESQMKFMTEIDNGNDSFIYQHSLIGTKDSAVSKNSQDVQQDKIKQKHLKILKSIQCQQNVNKLRKLPKSQLMKYVHKIKHQTEEVKQHSNN